MSFLYTCYRLWAEMSAELQVLQNTQWDLLNPDSPPNSQLVAFINAQALAALEESSSSSEDESADEGSVQSSQDLFAFFSTPPHQA